MQHTVRTPHYTASHVRMQSWQITTQSRVTNTIGSWELWTVELQSRALGEDEEATEPRTMERGTVATKPQHHCRAGA